MMKDKNGFTLVELLAVIVVLAVILVIAGTSFTRIKRNANIEEAKKIEQSLTDLGPNIYSYEYITNNGAEEDDEATFMKKYNGLAKKDSFNISLDTLKGAGYLKNVSIKNPKNPSGNDVCNGYLKVTKGDDGPEFKGYICCPDLYKTVETGETNENNEYNCDDYNGDDDITLGDQ